MRRILHEHPIALCVALFIPIMLFVKVAASFLVGTFGAWIAIPIIGAMFALAPFIGRADRAG